MACGDTRDGPEDMEGKVKDGTNGEDPRRISSHTASPRHSGGDPQPPHDKPVYSALQFSGLSSLGNLQGGDHRQQYWVRKGSPLSARSNPCRVLCIIIGEADAGLRARIVADMTFVRFSQSRDDESKGLTPIGVRVPKLPPTLSDGVAMAIPDPAPESAAVI